MAVTQNKVKRLSDIFVTWIDYLEKNKITYEPLPFDIDIF